MCETAKEGWDILEVTHKGTKIVKNSKLQLLTSKFEEIRMKEEDTFDEFYAKLNDIVSSSFNLGEKILETRIMRKIMRSLPQKLRPKVITMLSKKVRTLTPSKFRSLWVLFKLMSSYCLNPRRTSLLS
jgi:hypothetical protein